MDLSQVLLGVTNVRANTTYPLPQVLGAKGTMEYLLEITAQSLRRSFVATKEMRR